MPVDEFGRNGDRTTTTVYTGINIANIWNIFIKPNFYIHDISSFLS